MVRLGRPARQDALSQLGCGRAHRPPALPHLRGLPLRSEAPGSGSDCAAAQGRAGCPRARGQGAPVCRGAGRRGAGHRRLVEPGPANGETDGGGRRAPRPGWTTYPVGLLAAGFGALYGELQKRGNPPWGGVEANAGMAGGAVDWETYLGWHYNHGATLVAINTGATGQELPDLLEKLSLIHISE